MSVTVLRADTRALPLPDGCADLVVTSPPYFGLRSYTDGGEHYGGQIGSEATPREWLAALLEATREWVRVLKPGGSIFVNLGDKYDSGTTTPRVNPGTVKDGQGQGWHQGTPRVSLGQPKSLMGLPWRYALACIDDLGLILRAEIIWAKPNGLPESVTDRVRRSHEQVFHFTRQPRYYAAVDEIREPHARVWGGKPNGGGYYGTLPAGLKDANLPNAMPNPLGKLPGSVWDINEGETLVRSVLRAVSAGGITIDEAERLITGGPAWTGSGGSTPGSSARTAAGTGSGGLTPKATESTAAHTMGNAEFTASPTNSGPGPFLTGSPSTTSAATADVSTQPTLKPSPSGRTSGEDHRPSRLIAPAATSSLLPIPTSGATGTENAGPACEPGSVPTTPGDVWSIPSQPLTVPAHLGIDHFAAFPMELPRRIILGWSPPGVCTACGEGRRPVAEADYHVTTADIGAASKRLNPGQGNNFADRRWDRALRQTAITGYACACPQPDAPTRPALVVDPFGGTGTTALVATMHGRHGISVDRSADYCRLAAWRTTDPAQRAAALQVPKPPPVPDGMEPLFEFSP